MAGEKVTSEKISGKERKSTETKEAVTVNIEERAGSDAKASKPEDRWMWAFEDGFLQPFLQAKAKVVDRATIIRLTAAESDKGATLQPIVAKQTETDALKGYADILVEILITRSPSSLYGYEFKASAKDLKTGSIIANVTSLRWKAKDHPGRVVVASSEGYKVTNEVKLPAVADVASGLTTDLMNALIRFWGK